MSLRWSLVGAWRVGEGKTKDFKVYVKMSLMVKDILTIKKAYAAEAEAEAGAAEWGCF